MVSKASGSGQAAAKPNSRACTRKLGTAAVVAIVVCTSVVIGVGLSMYVNGLYLALNCAKEGDGCQKWQGGRSRFFAPWPLDPLDTEAHMQPSSEWRSCFFQCNATDRGPGGEVVFGDDTNGCADADDMWEAGGRALLDGRPAADPNTTDIITIGCSLSEVKIENHQAKATCKLEFWGKYNMQLGMPGLQKQANPGMRPPQRNTSLIVWMQSKKIRVDEGMYPDDVEVTLGLGGAGVPMPGHIHRAAKWYPFVSLHFELWFMAIWTADEGKTALDLPLPLAFTLDYDYIPMYQMTSVPECVYGGDTSREWTALVGDIGINNMFKLYGVGALHVLTWALAVASFSMSIIWAVTEHIELRYDLLCFSGSLLFALPGMRGLLPGAPQAGLWYDLINIHAQLWLISIGIIIQFGRILFDHAFRKQNAAATNNAAGAASCSCTCACTHTVGAAAAAGSSSMSHASSSKSPTYKTVAAGTQAASLPVSISQPPSPATPPSPPPTPAAPGMPGAPVPSASVAPAPIASGISPAAVHAHNAV